MYKEAQTAVLRPLREFGWNHLGQSYRMDIVVHDLPPSVGPTCVDLRVTLPDEHDTLPAGEVGRPAAARLASFEPACLARAAEETKDEERDLRGLVGVAAAELAQEERDQEMQGSNEEDGTEDVREGEDAKEGELVDTDEDSFDLDLGEEEGLVIDNARDATSTGAHGDDDQNVAHAATESSTGQGGDGSLGLDPG